MKNDRVTLKQDWTGNNYDVLLDGELVVNRLKYTEARETCNHVMVILRVAEIVKGKPATLKSQAGRKVR